MIQQFGLYPRLLVVFLIFLSTATSSADDLYIAVAANFTTPIKQLKLRFTKDFGHNLIVSIGSTGQLYTQIKNGAPYQVFLAADRERPQMLVNENIAVAGSLFTYAIGQLVLWSSHAKLINTDGKVLFTNKFQHLAIAHPKMAPYGTATKQVLQKLKLWQRLQSKIVRGNSVGKAYQFTVTGSAELGFIAFSQYVTGKLRGSYWLVPNELYDPIQQGAVLLKQGKKQSAAQAFMQFLRSSSARKIIEQFGYVVRYSD